MGATTGQYAAADCRDAKPQTPDSQYACLFHAPNNRLTVLLAKRESSCFAKTALPPPVMRIKSAPSHRAAITQFIVPTEKAAVIENFSKQFVHFSIEARGRAARFSAPLKKAGLQSAGKRPAVGEENGKNFPDSLLTNGNFRLLFRPC